MPIPTFTNPITTLTVLANATATDIKSLLTVNDTDPNQTETWSQVGAPSHGTLNFVSATAASGSANITSGGTITYTPTTGYTGFDSFLVQVSDGASIALRSFSVTVNNNLAPTFIGTTTALTVTENAVATDIKGLLHISDTDASQTETWTQSAAPAHGLLSFTSATIASGSTDLITAGTINYTPTAGYAGTDSFTVQVSDGTATASKIISVNVTPAVPSTPVLATASDSGSNNTDTITNAMYLNLSGTSAASDTTSTVRVFVDSNGNGGYDSSIEPSQTTTVNAGNWSVTGLYSSGSTNGTYNIYAFTTSATGNLTSWLSSALSVTIDTTAPTAPTISLVATDDVVNSTEKTAGITVTGTCEALTTVTLNGAVATVAGTNWSYLADSTTIGNLGEGSKTLTVVSTDLAGNTATATRGISIDSTAPTVILTSNVSALKIGGTATITATFSEAVTGFDVSDLTSANGTFTNFAVNSSDAKIYTATFTPTVLSPATDSAITIAADSYTDTAGNNGGAGAKPALAMDMVAPLAPTFALNSDTGANNSDNITSDNVVNVSGLEDGAMWIYKLGIFVHKGSDTSFVLTSDMIYDVEQIVVRQTDVAGNVSSTTSNTVAFTEDSTAPTATATAATIQSSGNAVVQSNELGTAYLVNSSVNVSSLTDITSAADNNFNQVTISAINTNTDLAATGLVDGSYNVYTVDVAGNLSTAVTGITLSTPVVVTATVVTVPVVVVTTPVVIEPVVTSPVVVVPPVVEPVVTVPVVTPVVTPTPAPVVVAPVEPTPAPVYSGGSEPAPVVVAPVVPVIPATFIADGVTVQQTFTMANGAQVGHFTVSPISTTSSSGHSKIAQIPLGTVDKGAGVTLGLPVGVGFQADGVTSPQFINTAISNLGDDLKAMMGADSAAVIAGTQFLFKAAAGQTFFEQKLVLTSNSSNITGEPIVIDGTHTGSTSVLNTFVIDTKALPKGSTVELVKTR